VGFARRWGVPICVQRSSFGDDFASRRWVKYLVDAVGQGRALSSWQPFVKLSTIFIQQLEDQLFLGSIDNKLDVGVFQCAL